MLNSPSASQLDRTAGLGCGRGYDAVLFADRGFEVIGFDFAASAIVDATCLAQERGSSAQFLQRDIFELAAEFPSHFDYIVEHTCFCAIPVEKRNFYVKKEEGRKKKEEGRRKYDSLILIFNF